MGDTVMISLDFKEISFEKHTVSEVATIRQTNNWSVCAPNGRELNGFLLITKGECVYSWQDNEVKLSEGSIIYLPKGSVHSVTAPERSLEFYRISFILSDKATGEEIVFSRTPMLITHNASKRMFDVCEELRVSTLGHYTGFHTMALICELIDYSSKVGDHGQLVGIDAVEDYLSGHYTEDVKISAVAEKFFMSEAYLYRLFKQKYSCSPIEYKNALRVKKAKSLLFDPYCSIGEIADILGFENACYFTRIFKKHTGISPTEYRKQIKEK